MPKGPAGWLAIAVGERGAEEGGTLRRGRVERFLLKNQVASAVARLFLCSASYSDKTRPKELYSLSILSTLSSTPYNQSLIRLLARNVSPTSYLSISIEYGRS